MAEDFKYSPLAIRGVHLDCRAQMQRLERIGETFEDLARWGFNTVLLEYEDRFPYRGPLKQLAGEDALSRSQVRQLVKVADGLGLRIIPLVQCLGHLEYVLQFPQFADLADGKKPSGWASTLCPSEERSVKLYQQMVQQVLELHGDCRHFHMGGDEASLNVECPRCLPRRRQEGVSPILVDHYVRCADWLRGQGPEPILWCDMPLRHPEAMDRLRGRATIMDWDYWSGTEPRDENPRVWGLPAAVLRSPRDWPAAHRELFAKYIFTEGGLARPFPYTAFLRDRGFQVIVASAVRSSGDSFCAPAPRHVDNAVGAARAASENHVLGSVITSWAIRRSPWPLTEYGLIAGAMTMNDPRIDRREIDAAFAAEHFGVGDPELARIAALVGTPLAGLIDSRPRFDGHSHGWLGCPYSERIELIRQMGEKYPQALAALRDNLQQAETLLAKARPRTSRQKARVATWKWAIAVLKHFAAFGGQVLKAPGEHDAGELREFRAQAKKLAARTARMLKGIYTDRTVRDEQQTRFGIHLDYLGQMIEASTRRA